jgi:hypothetical protein
MGFASAEAAANGSHNRDRPTAGGATTTTASPIATSPIPRGMKPPKATNAPGSPATFLAPAPSSHGTMTPATSVLCSTLAFQPTEFLSEMEGDASVVCSGPVQTLSLQECLQNLITGGWVTVACHPGASSSWTEHGVSYIDGNEVQDFVCVIGRWYRMWAWSWPLHGNAAEATDTSAGTKCQA